MIEALVYNLQMEMKQLKADFQAIQEESVSQKGQQATLEKSHRYHLQQLNNYSKCCAYIIVP